MKKVLYIFLLFATINISAQFSKTHYIPPVSCTYTQSMAPNEQFMYISCPSTTPVKFKINQLGSTVITGTVSRDTPYSLNIGTGTGTQLIASNNEVGTVLSNKGYVVEADDLVYVTVRLVAGNNDNQEN